MEDQLRGKQQEVPWEEGRPGRVLSPAESLPSGLAYPRLTQCLPWSLQGLGYFQICFRFQFPLLLKPPQGRKKQTVILS